MISLKVILVVASLALASLSSAAQSAVIVSHNFIAVYGDTGLFGPLYGSANSSQIDAHPSTFIAQTVGVGISSASASASIFIQADTGYVINQITFVAAGDYSLFKFSPSDNVGVAVAGQLRVNPMGTLDNYTSPLTVTSPFLANTPFDFDTHDWVSNATVTLPHGITGAWVTWQKLLYGYGDQVLGQAFIQNKFDAMVVLTSPVSPIPEPSSKWLLLIGFISLTFFTNRRNCQ